MSEVIRVENFSEFQEFIISSISEIFIYRGVSSKSYKLIPKIWRTNLNRSKRKRLQKEKASFNTFVNSGRSLLTRDPIDDWDWLAIAQHHGVSTRLLDWSHNPMVAAYFAVANQKSALEPCIYAYRCQRNGKDVVSFDEYPDPFSVPEVLRVVPRHANKRIVAQSGLFTIHPAPGEVFDSPRLTKLEIKATFKKELKNVVRKFGITPFSVFPDLDGLAAHINELNDRY